jgi:aryl-alcohol dehydrogenase-like predicted oxidoreductase
MSYCSLEKGSHTWALNEEKSRSFIEKALELGINFFDTATSIQMTPAKRCWAGGFRS